MVNHREFSTHSEEVYIQQLVRSIPAPIIERVVKKWKGKSIKFTEENKCNKFRELFKDLPRSWRIQLKKLSRLTAVDNIIWSPFIIEKKPKFKPQQYSKPIKFSTKDLIKAKVDVSGFLHVFTLSKNIYLLAVEFSSRSDRYRNEFHYLLIPNKKLLFVEQKENSMHFFEEVWNKTLSLKLKEQPIRPVVIRRAVQKFGNINDERINLLRITLSQVISGFRGLTGITLAGDDVLAGLQGMKVRHDLDINFSDLGPWTEVHMNTFHLIAGKGIKMKGIDGITQAIELFVPVRKR
ncbi:MAG: hypothetical protein ACE5I5_02570 [Candidatus Heimdallarchaeota archaeon]